MQGEVFLHASRLERPSLDTALPGGTGDAAACGHPGVQVEPAETAKKARPPRLPRTQESPTARKAAPRVNSRGGFSHDTAQTRRESYLSRRVSRRTRQKMPREVTLEAFQQQAIKRRQRARQNNPPSRPYSRAPSFTHRRTGTAPHRFPPATLRGSRSTSSRSSPAPESPRQDRRPCR